MTFLGSAARSVSFLGNILVFGFFVVLLFLFDLSWFFLSLGLVLVFTTVIVYLIKWLYPTKRPDFRRGEKPPKWFWLRVDRSSFPSAHAARAGGFAMLAFLYPWWQLQVFSVVFLVVVCYSRVYLKRHFWRDIAGGLAIGLLCGLAAWFLTGPLTPVFLSVMSFFGLHT